MLLISAVYTEGATSRIDEMPSPELRLSIKLVRAIQNIDACMLFFFVRALTFISRNMKLRVAVFR